MLTYARTTAFWIVFHRTVFDVDLETLEEKPWRRPGVDITDYFNFKFTEATWKQYCRQLVKSLGAKIFISASLDSLSTCLQKSGLNVVAVVDMKCKV
jgi:hypothetical protein